MQSCTIPQMYLQEVGVLLGKSSTFLGIHLLSHTVIKFTTVPCVHFFFLANMVGNLRYFSPFLSWFAFGSTKIDMLNWDHFFVINMSTFFFMMTKHKLWCIINGSTSLFYL